MFKLIKTLVLSAVCVVGSQSWAQELNPSIPTYHPSCKTVFESTGLKVLTSKDCSTIFLAPADVGEVRSRVTPNRGNLQSCSLLTKTRENLMGFQIMMEEMNNELFEATINADESEIERVKNTITMIRGFKDDAESELSRLSQLEGGLVTVLFHNEVKDSDMKHFVETNSVVFQNLGYIPRIQRANIKDSIYSFNFIKEPVSKIEPIILSTSIPGLEALNQNGAQQQRVAHVMSTGPISGQLQVSLNGMCGLDDSDNSINDDDFSNAMVVNRVYNIPTVSEYGYRATLDVSRITRAMGRRFSETSNHGYTLTQVNNIIYDNEFKDDFHIEFYEGHEPDSPLQIQEISNDVLDRLVEKYLAELENVNLIEVTGYEDYIPAEGGMVTVQQTGRTCKRKWYGSKRCWNTVYNVQKWVDGYSELDVDEYSNVQLQFTESMNVQDIVKKPMGSTFSSIKLN